jgi:glycogen(starch) synthase
MKILVYSHHFWPSIGGTERVVESLARGSAARGHSVTVVTSIPAGGFDDASLPYRVVRRPGIPALARLLREHDIAHLAGLAMAPLLLGWLGRKRVVVEHHGFQAICPNGQLYYEPGETFCPGHFMAGRHRECLRCNASQGRMQSARMWLLTFPRRWLCRRVTQHILPTEWLASLLRLTPAVTIHHGIEPGVGIGTPAAREAGPPVFLFLGRLVTTKGVRVLMEAAARLRAQGCEFVLRIIGDGPDRGRLEEMARTHGLESSVQFPGPLPDKKLDEALEGVRAVVVPSLAGEVFGMVAAEQMKKGRAVIVSDLGAFREVVGDAGLIFPAGDAGALAGCMRKVIEDPGLAATLGTNGRRRAEMLFDMERMIDEHLDVYRALWQRGAGRSQEDARGR